MMALVTWLALRGEDPFPFWLGSLADRGAR
jgi:hypothetical protein